MTRNKFAALCSQYGIAPQIALENDRIVAALKIGNDILVEMLLETEF